MNKELIPALVLILGLFSGALFYSETVQKPFLALLTFTKTTYHDTVENIQNRIDEHFFQKKSIRSLKRQLEQYNKEHLILKQLRAQNHDLFLANNSSLVGRPGVDLVHVLSYAKFGDNRKLWLKMDDFNSSKVYGMVYNELAAGIVVSSHEQPMALLNGDPKCSYAVFVGERRAPGILHGNNSNTLTVKFIPTWIPIHKGDEVITSGLDNLFFYGLQVGKVLSVTLSQGYQSAIIKPYYLADQPNYFHVIKQL